MASSSSNVVGVHYRVGKKIGEGSFGVIFEGTNLLNNQQVAIKFVRPPYLQTTSLRSQLKRLRLLGYFYYIALEELQLILNSFRNLERVMPHNYETSIEHTKYLLAAVSIPQEL